MSQLAQPVGGFAFKYARQLRAIGDCPPSGCQSCDGIGFRFASSNAADARNFKPVAVLTPNRKFRSGLLAKRCCTAYALSMYQTFDHLKAAAKKGLKNSPQFLKRIGGHYIELHIKPHDGRTTNPGASGHFDFFESASFVATGALKSHGVLGL